MCAFVSYAQMGLIFSQLWSLILNVEDWKGRREFYYHSVKMHLGTSICNGQGISTFYSCGLSHQCLSRYPTCFPFLQFIFVSSPPCKLYSAELAFQSVLAGDEVKARHVWGAQLGRSSHTPYPPAKQLFGTDSSWESALTFPTSNGLSQPR